jgi:2-polyprenyl-3-methyl-5-hydroxy-6-metoxy-1,4-benzoquinol methylase
VSDEARVLHNSVANEDDVTASTRPPATKLGDLDRMVRDVLAKLAVDDSTEVCEIGCGTGVLAIPIAKRAKSFVGIDFADAAVAVLERKLTEGGLSAEAKCVVMDFVGAAPGDLTNLGTFDRVLVYGTLHFMESEAEVRLFFDRAVGLLRPGGIALFGNLPLVDHVSIERPARWKAKALAVRCWRKLGRLVRREHDVAPVVRGLEPLRGALLEKWAADAGATFRWELPAVGTPLFWNRLDLLVKVHQELRPV